MEWLGWLEKIDPKQVPSLLIMGLGIYIALRRRTAALEIRMAKVEAETATIQAIHQRLDDLFALVKVGLLGERSQASPIVGLSPTDEIRLREIARAARDR